MNRAIPEKLYYKIGEVALLVGVKTSVLRFWEAEFDFLKPEKSSTGQRLYTQKEVTLLQEIKRLLYTEKFTLEGVKKRATSRGALRIEDVPRDTHQDHLTLLREIKTDLQTLRCQL